MRHLAKAAIVLCISCTLARPVRADPSVAVVLGPGAEHCPNGPELNERVQSLRGEARADAVESYDVLFARDERGLSASIRARRGTSSRVLRDGGPSCSALAQATAVTLALLFDSHTSDTTAQASVQAASPPAPPALPPPPPDRPAESSASQRPSRASATLSLGGGVLAGVIAPIVPAFFGDAGIELSRFRTSVGALAVFSRTTQLEPGSVRQSLVGGLARSCIAPYKNAALRVDVCSGIYAGVLTGQGSGYTQNEWVKTPWLALPLELALRNVAPGFGWELGVAALVPIRRHDFSVDGVGIAYESPAIAGLLSLRAVGLWAL